MKETKKQIFINFFNLTIDYKQFKLFPTIQSSLLCFCLVSLYRKMLHIQFDLCFGPTVFFRQFPPGMVCSEYFGQCESPKEDGTATEDCRVGRVYQIEENWRYFVFLIASSLLKVQKLLVD